MRGKNRISPISLPDSRAGKPKYKSLIPTKIITSLALFLSASTPILLLAQSPCRLTLRCSASLTLAFVLCLKTIYSPIPKLTVLYPYFFSDLMRSTLCLLTIYLVLLCYIISTPILSHPTRTSYAATLWALNIVLISCFLIKTVFWFYISFEFALLPTILCARNITSCPIHSNSPKL